MKNYNRPNSQRAIAIIKTIKAVSLFVVASSIATDHPYVGLICGAVAAGCVELITALSDKNDPNTII